MQLSLPARTTSVFGAETGRVLIDATLWPFYLSIIGLCAIVIWGVSLGPFDFEAMPILSMAIVAAGLCGLGMTARWLTVFRLADLLEALGLFYASALLVPLVGTILATSNLPLVDGPLSRAEPYLFFGLTRDGISGLFQSSDAGRLIGRAAYNSLNWQPVLLLACLFITGRAKRGWAFMAAWFIALGLTLIIFPFAPATSTPAHGADDWVVVLKQVRSGELRTLGVHTLVGIVAFPSFHAAAATLLGWGFAAFGRYAMPFIALNGVMLLSAVPAGGHYLPDLAAGVIVAIAAVRIATRSRHHRDAPMSGAGRVSA